VPPIPAVPLELLELLLLELLAFELPPAPASPLEELDDVVVFVSGGSPQPTIVAAPVAATPVKSTADKIVPPFFCVSIRIPPSSGHQPEIQGNRRISHDMQQQKPTYPRDGFLNIRFLAMDTIATTDGSKSRKISKNQEIRDTTIFRLQLILQDIHTTYIHRKIRQ
jgi:hypothetical protein